MIVNVTTLVLVLALGAQGLTESGGANDVDVEVLGKVEVRGQRLDLSDGRTASTAAVAPGLTTSEAGEVDRQPLPLDRPFATQYLDRADPAVEGVALAGNPVGTWQPALGTAEPPDPALGTPEPPDPVLGTPEPGDPALGSPEPGDAALGTPEPPDAELGPRAPRDPARGGAGDVVSTPAPPPVVESPGDSRPDEAMALISYPWRRRLAGWEIAFEPARDGLRGLTLSGERRIEIYVRDGDSAWFLARVLAHEIGHAVDLTLLDTQRRRRWEQARGFAETATWWPASGVSDFASGAGDFAECFATWQVGSASRSEIAGPCSADHLALVAELS